MRELATDRARHPGATPPGARDGSRRICLSPRVALSVRSAEPGTIPRRIIHLTAMLAAVALTGLTAAVAEAAVINDPPPAGRSLIAFPARDFVSGDGYLDDHAYRVEVEHPASLGGGVVVSQRRISPTGGVLEVNHPGGACWVGSTPDIRPGDIVRVIDEDTGEVDQTTVANVTAKRPVQTAPGTIEIHGTARTADGAPMPTKTTSSFESARAAAMVIISVGVTPDTCVMIRGPSRVGRKYRAWHRARSRASTG